MSLNINIPGLGNSSENHWQSIWEREFPDDFYRVQQKDWSAPDRLTWTTKLEEDLKSMDHQSLIFIGHSVGCATIVHWFQTFRHKIKGALLVAPSDVDRTDYPSYITGFNPMPLDRLPFPSIVVASTNDHVISLERAEHFARSWGSQFVTIEDAGHVEEKNGFGKWNDGLFLIKQLRSS